MSIGKETTAITQTTKKQSIGNQIRSIADRLKQETSLQIKATSRILGAAAQIAENHDNLVDEVVGMVEQDLDRQVHQSQAYSVEALKQHFKTLGNAKAHFGLKAASWAALAEKLSSVPVKKFEFDEQVQGSTSQRIEVIEQELKIMQSDIKQILALVTELLPLVRQRER